MLTNFVPRDRATDRTDTRTNQRMAYCGTNQSAATGSDSGAYTRIRASG